MDIENMDEEELFELYSDYTSETGEDSIYYNDSDFYSELFGDNPEELARSIYYSANYDFTDKYATFDGYGNITTSNDLYSFIEKNEDNFKEWLKERGYDEDEED